MHVRDESTAQVPSSSYRGTNTSAFEAAVSDRVPSEMLLRQLLGFQGCRQQEHAIRIGEHVEEFTAENIEHHRLSAIHPPSMIICPVLRNSILLRPSDVAARAITPETLAASMEGRTPPTYRGEQSAPRHVCIHASHIDEKATGSTISFDCDSHFGWATSFRAFRPGVVFFPVSPKTQQMQAELHLPRDPQAARGVFDPDTHSFLKLDTTTHLYFGQIQGHDIRIYIFFPEIRNPSTLLTADQNQLWYDRVLMPAVRSSCPSDMLSSFPSTHQIAQLNSTAAQTEGRSRQTQSTGRVAHLQYVLDAASCETLWENIVTIIETRANESLAIFQGAVLFFTAKGHKMAYRNADLAHSLKTFDDFVQKTYDLDHVENMVIDVGKEVTPATDLAASAFFRECCVRSALSKLFISSNGSTPALSKSIVIYNHCGLRDLVNVTATPPHNSVLAEYGVMYAQYYSQVKQGLDVTKRYPFADPSLDTLAVGSERAEGLSSAGKTTVDTSTITASYVHSKHRVDETTKGDRRRLPHAAREEYRMTYSAFLELLFAADDEVMARSPTTSSSDLLHSALSPCFVIPTHEYINFVWYSTNQYCAYFETVLAECHHHPSPQQTRMLLLLLDIVRAFVQAVNFPSRRALWINVKQNLERQTTEIGAGFSRTMLTYGYCWLTPIVDWQRHTFLPQFQEYIVEARDRATKRFVQRRHHVSDFDEVYTAITTCEQILESWKVAAVHEAVITALACLVLRQFRADIRETVKDDIQAHMESQFHEEGFSFTWKHLTAFYRATPHLVAVERPTAASRNPDTLLNLWFGDLNQNAAPARSRLHFHRKPFRRLAYLAERICASPHLIRPAGLGPAPFQVILRSLCFLQHTVLPSIAPTHGHLTELKKGDAGAFAARRQWIAIHLHRDPRPNSRPNFGSSPRCYHSLGGPVDEHREPTIHALSTMSPTALTEKLIKAAERNFGIKPRIGRALRLRDVEDLIEPA